MLLPGHGMRRTGRTSAAAGALCLVAERHTSTLEQCLPHARVATAHRILDLVYHLLTRSEDYCEPGPDYYRARDHQALERRLLRQVRALGYEVTLQPPSAPAA